MIVIPKFLFGRELHRFVVVGGIGFCIDGGLLTILMKFDWGVIPARSLSFLLAVCATWLLNRLGTFKFKKSMSTHMEYVCYFGIQVLGALINFSIFFVLIKIYPLFRDTPLIPLAFGAVVSLAFNYTALKITIFKR